MPQLRFKYFPLVINAKTLELNNLTLHFKWRANVTIEK